MTQKKNNFTQHDPPIEAALRHALQRDPAPEGLDARILARVAERTRANSKPPVSGWLEGLFSQPIARSITRSITRWATVAALAVALVTGGLEYLNQRRERRERAQGEAAKQQLMLALRIAGSKLQLAKSKVNQINATRSGRTNTENDN
jgi:hypothetical protein